MKEKILINNGIKLLPVKVILGTVAAIMALGMPNYLIPGFAILSAAAFTMNSGIEIDFKSKRIRSFFSYFWIRSGKWSSLDMYKNITVKKERKGATIYGGRTDRSVTQIDHYYDVYLSSENFRIKILLFSSKNREESSREAEKWSQRFELPVVKYAPKPSKKTINRRRK